MDLEKALLLLKTIIEKCHFDEIGFTSAKHPLDDKDILDIIIQENVHHWQLQELDNILAEYADVEMEFDLGNDQLRIFRKEQESS
jgi:hypothetical protein